MSNQYPEIYTQFLANILIIGFLIAFVVLLVLFYQKRKIQQAREMEYMKAQMEKELLTTQLEIQEEIQQAISMEMHDNVGQALLLANINVSILQAQLKDTPDGASLAKETKLMISKAMEDITIASRSLNSDRITQNGVFTVIGTELENLQRKGLFTVSINDQFSDKQLIVNDNTQLSLFRIYQELIKNVIKYASASLVNFSITPVANGWQMVLNDNGKGFDTATMEKADGIGFRSIQKRVSLFEGRLSVNSTPGKGTTITIFIPGSLIHNQEANEQKI